MVTVMASMSFATTEEDRAEERQFFRGMGRQPALQLMMEKLGLSKEDVLELRDSGKTIEEIAEENGIDLELWKENMFKLKEERIDKLVEEGKITAEEAEELKTLIEKRIENCPQHNEEGFMRPMMGNGFGRRMMGNGFRGWQD